MAAPQIDSAVVALILDAVVKGDAKLRGVTTTAFGLVIDIDAVDDVVEQLKSKEGKPK